MDSTILHIEFVKSLRKMKFSGFCLQSLGKIKSHPSFPSSPLKFESFETVYLKIWKFWTVY